MTGYRIAKASDIAAIFESLSEISDDEIAAFGISYAEAEAAAEEGVRRGCAFVALSEGQPTCLFWFYPGEGVCHTYFLSTEAYFDVMLASTRATRACLEMCAKSYPKTKLVSVTTSQHPSAEKWFRLIGFAKTGEEGDTKTFEYIAA